MRQYLLILALTSVCGNIFTQNLVINGDFENNFGCPIVYPNTPNWYYPTINSSPDFFHTCGTINILNVPTNGFGYQNAHSGNAYMGFVPYQGNNGKEYLSTRLNDTLITNNYYCFNMFVSLADSIEFGSNKLGVYISKDSVYVNTIFNLPFTPQIEFNQIITNSTEWILLEAQYQAVGGEKFITIGNFRTDNQTSLLSINSSGPSLSYYYIDDVSLYACEGPLPKDSLHLSLPNVFTPNGDGENDQFMLKVLGAHNIRTLTVQVFNRWGQRIVSSSFNDLAQLPSNAGITDIIIWDGYTNAAALSPEGTYFYVITYETLDSEVKTEKGSITLLR